MIIDLGEESLVVLIGVALRDCRGLDDPKARLSCVEDRPDLLRFFTEDSAKFERLEARAVRSEKMRRAHA